MHSNPKLPVREKQEIVRRINCILKKHSFNLSLQYDDICISDRSVTDAARSDEFAPLSVAIVQAIWPSQGKLEVFHYTSKTAADAIINSRKFRLYSLLRRADQGEIKPLLEAAGYSYYLEKDESGQPRFKSELMANTFYASFASSTQSETEAENCWKVYGRGEPVRLRLSITSTRSDFRRIYYANQSNDLIPILKDISELVENEFHRTFILKGISRLCCFYLPSELKIENEYRVLHKYRENGPVPNVDENGKYIELNLGAETIGYKLDLIEIMTNEKLSSSVYDDLIVPRP